MSLNRQQAIFLQHVAELIRKAPELGLTITGGELYRTPEQQAMYLRDGRSKTMNSQHLKRLAIDLNFFVEQPDGSLRLVYDDERVRQLGQFWESLDPSANRWGGSWSSFKDVPHFERRESAGSKAAVAAAPAATPVVSAPPTPAAAPLGRMPRLAGTVGFRQTNQRDDVETIQRLLNLNAAGFGLDPLLKPDGIFGTKTTEAVRGFQQKMIGMAEGDGCVQPGDATLRALCATLPGALDAVLLQFIFLAAAEDALAALAAPIIDTMQRHDITTPLRAAHFIAQIGHESGELRYREEIASGAAYEGRRDLGNTQPGDGRRYKGRGLIQLTGRANYAEYSKTSGLDVDVVAEPARVATDDRLCVDVAGWYWSRREINALADRDDLEAVTRRINGGLNGLADRRRLLGRAKALLGA